MAATNVQAFSGDVELNGILTINSSVGSIKKKSFTSYSASGITRYWKVASGNYDGGRNHVKMTVNIHRLDTPNSTHRLVMKADGGSLTFRPCIDEHESGTPSYLRDLRVYKNTSDTTFDIYIQVSSFSYVDVEMMYSGSSITVYDTPTWESSEPTTSGTYLLEFTNGNLNAMKIDNSGRVGIGTANPGAPFEVHGAELFGQPDGTTGILSRHVAGEDGVLNIFGVQSGNGEERVGLQTQIDGRAWQSDIDGGWSYGNDDRYVLSLQTYKGRVGIGKTTPNCTLDINDSTSQYNGIFSKRLWLAAVGDNSGNGTPDDNTGSPWRGLGFDDLAWNNQSFKYSGDIPILSGYEGVALRTGAGNLVLTEVGNVGVGVTNPLGKLYIAADYDHTLSRPSSDSSHYLVLSKTGVQVVDQGPGISFCGSYSPTNDFQDVMAEIRGVCDTGGGRQGRLEFWTSSSGGINRVDTQAMTIKNNGNVGIGTTNPGHLLDLYRNTTNGASIRLRSSGTGEVLIGKKSSSGNDQSLQFTNNSVTGAQSSYQFLTPLSSNWRYPLTIFGDARLAMNGNSITHNKNGVLTIYSTNEGNLVDQFVFKACTDTNVIGFFLNAAGAQRGSIQGVNASSIVYNSTSDERLKKQIKPMQSTLDRVNALKPSTYTWIRDEAKGFGFIAQEVYKVFPEMRPVAPYSGCTCKCGMERCETCTLCDDEHDYPKNKDGTDFYYGLDYGTFTPFLTKAIQELDAKVEEHHNRKSLVTDVEYSAVGDYEGLVVSASTNEYKNGRPVLKLSNAENDKKSYGVILGKAKSVDNETNVQKSGDGRMWVVNTSGNIESGDLVTSSNIGGYGKKQDDDILRSYTVAKVTQDCDFTERYIPVKRVKQEMKDVTYYLQENYVKVADMRTVKEEDVIEREVPMYVKSVGSSEDSDAKVITPNISEEEYNALTEDEKKSYTVSYLKYITPYEYNRIPEAEKADYQETTQTFNYTRELYESSKPMPYCCGEYTTEIRQELVDVLDENGQIVWEETDELELVYKMKYLDANGVETDEANAVHKAAFVGCTYHCG